MKTKIYLLLMLCLLVPAALWAIGNAGYALSFDGTDDAVIVPDNALLDNLAGDYTIEAWINVNGYTNYDRIADRDGVFAFYLGASNSFGFRGPLGSPELNAPINTVTAGWHHVAVRVVDNAGTYTGTLFYDGAPVASLSDASLNLPANTTPLAIGNRAALDRSFNGTLDEVRIWSVARSNGDIQTNRGVVIPAATAGLLALYRMDEGTGQVVNDLTANNLDGGRGSDAVNPDANDPAWLVSTAPIGFNLLAPNGGVLNAGAAVAVTWAVNPALATVDLLISFDGVKFLVWSAGVANTGTANLIAPAYPTTAAVVKVANPANAAEFDVSDNPITIDMTGFVPAYITREAESATLYGSNMYVLSDGEAFDCKFIFSSKNYVASNYADISFNVPVAGLYVVWARVMGPGGERNSWRVSMNGGPILDYHVPSAGYHWRWDQVSNGPSISTPIDDPVYFYLTAGAHTIRFIDREHYTRLDRITVTNNLNPSLSLPEPNKWIRITDPTDEMYGADKPKLYRNEPYEIKWTSYNIGSTVTIEFSIDEGRTYPYLIARGTANDGSFLWTVPDVITENGVLRISAGNGTDCPMDMSFEELHITNPPPAVVVVAPNGGEVLVAGTTTQVTWTNKYYTGNVTLSYSLNNGATWTVITSNLVNTGAYAWAIPADIASTQCLVKVADATTASPMDVSNAVFTIAAPPPPPAPDGITVSEPNGGEIWEVGTVRAVTWTVDGFDDLVNVYFSSDNGVNWTTLVTDVAATGIYEWTIPNVLSTQCLIKVAESTTATPFDISDAQFSIVAPGSTEPEPDYALRFDGMNDLVTVPNAPSLNVSGSFTIEFWMKTEDPAQKWRRILEKGSWDEYYIAFYGTTGRMCGALRTAIPGGSRMDNILGPSTSLMAANAWIHVAATFDGTTAKMYINGHLESTKAATVSPRSLINDLIIGGAKHAATYEYHYQGVLDELRIWNGARSEAQIVAGMFVQLDGSEAGLAAYYPFNEGSGQVAGDLSPNANHGILGKLNEVEDCDPLWVLSDRPVSGTSMTALQYAMIPAEEEAGLYEVPEEFELLQNYPNPFNATTTIIYNVPNASDHAINVKLQIFDLQGRLIKTLFDGVSQPGRHQAVWNGYNGEGQMTASGVYFYRLQAGNFIESKRMIMLK